MNQAVAVVQVRGDNLDRGNGVGDDVKLKRVKPMRLGSLLNMSTENRGTLDI